MQLKHLFVFLLVFLVSIADATVYSQRNSSEYYQSSKVFQKKTIRVKNTKHFAFYKTISKDYFLAFFFSNRLLDNTSLQQIVLILKLQKELYQEIALYNIKHTFLIQKSTSSNSNSNIYIA
jgi:hypothetical protein